MAPEISSGFISAPCEIFSLALVAPPSPSLPYSPVAAPFLKSAPSFSLSVRSDISIVTASLPQPLSTPPFTAFSFSAPSQIIFGSPQTLIPSIFTPISQNMTAFLPFWIGLLVFSFVYLFATFLFYWRRFRALRRPPAEPPPLNISHF